MAFKRSALLDPRTLPQLCQNYIHYMLESVN
jgi:hypothetical protein